MVLKVGTLCYPTDSGLGILAKSFYDNGVVTHPFVVRHAHFTNHEVEWYPGCPQMSIHNLKSNLRLIEGHCKNVDVMLFFETPFVWELLPYCRLHGVKTVLMTMYECTPARLPYRPDAFLCPSLLDLRYFPERSTFLPVPVDTNRLRPRVRHRARIFVHNAGHGGLKGRNGTREVIDAWRCLPGPANGIYPLLLLRTQKALPWGADLPGVSMRVGTLPYEEMYQDGDVFLFPEKFNGLSLPVQEAYASGMVVMCGDRFPMNAWLPKDPLIKVDRYNEGDSIGPAYNRFRSAVIHPEDVALKITEYCDKDITELSEAGIEWGRVHSWYALKKTYLDYLAGVSRL